MGHFGKTDTKTMREKPVGGTLKFGRARMIPKDAKKPADTRIKTVDKEDKLF